MTPLRHDRVLHLRDLACYPGQEWLDITCWLPEDQNSERRVWALVPESTPVFRLNDARLEPKQVSDGQPRWIDYGISELHRGFSQLRVKGLRPDECAESYLLITARQDFCPEGLSLEETEKSLWGLSCRDAGSTTCSPSRVPTGTPTTFTVRYSAGPSGLPEGARVRFSVPKAFALPQTTDPDGDGFVSVTRADCEVAIDAVEGSVESHEKVDIICLLGEALPASVGFELRYRSDFTYIFPVELHETDRRYWYSKLPPLAAAVALSEGSPLVAVAEGQSHTLEFVPGPAERLHLFLPSRRRVGEALTLRGTFTDQYRNSPPSGPIDAELEFVLVNGSVGIPLPPAAGHFAARHRFAVPVPELGPGVYRAEARHRESGVLVARSNPMEVMADDDTRDPVYWGEIHGHSEMSDGCNDYADRYRHARDEGCLDFAAAADHACYFSDNEWLWMQDVTNSWDEPGQFVTLNGYEWAGRQAHRNVYTSRDRLDLFRGMYPPTSNLDAVYPHFQGDEECVAGPHGPLAHGLVWEHHEPSVERFVEIYSMWGAGDSRENPLVPDFARNNPRGMTLSELLATGAKLGVTGGGDCHEGRVGFSSEDPDGQGTTPHTFAAILRYRCGMTASVMPGLDRASLIRSLRKRKTYATTGARILLDFSVAGLAMGDVGPAEEAECRIAAHGVEPIRTVEIVKDGEVVWRKGCGELDVVATWTDPERISGEHYYYVRVEQTNGEMAWSSPVWVSASL